MQSDTSMNGRVGYIRGRENVEDGGRFIARPPSLVTAGECLDSLQLQVELGTRGIARVREANLEKVRILQSFGTRQ